MKTHDEIWEYELNRMGLASMQIPRLPSNFIASLAESRAYGSVRSFARRVGIISHYRLTPLGLRMYSLYSERPHLFYDALHVHLYTAHLYDRSVLSSWVYAYLIDRLFALNSFTISTSFIYSLVTDAVEEASREYDMPVDRLSFSCDSVRSALSLLRRIEPSVLSRSHFALRHFCSPLVFLWAVSMLYTYERVSAGVRLRLTDERLSFLLRVCLLHRDALDSMLSTTCAWSDADRGGLFGYGWEGGRGFWIYLRDIVPIATILY